MKSLLILLLCFILSLSTSKTSGQNVTSINYSDNLVLDKMLQLNKHQCAKIITENLTLKIPLEFESAEDSLNMAFTEVNLLLKRVRFDPDKMMTIFPEVVNIDEFSNSNIDYKSLIPILWETISAQQKQINMLNSKIKELENELLK